MTKQAQVRICPTCLNKHAAGSNCALIGDHPFKADDFWPDSCSHVRGKDGFVCGFGRELHEPEVPASP